MIERATVSATWIEILLSESVVSEWQDRVLTIPWTRSSSRRRREIIQRVGEAQQPLRAMRTKARDGFIKASRDARRWLDELLFDPAQSIDLLAVREGKSERSIRMTLSLAFVSPVLVEAAMEGRLPRGFSVKRLTDLPMLWSEQWHSIGLQQPISASASASPSRGPGNGILWAETGGRFQAQNAGERPEFGSQTANCLTNRPKLRGFLSTRKPRRFAGTAWWGMQELN